MKGIVYPFSDIFNYSTFSLYIPGEDITVRGQSIISILEAIPRQTIKTMQETVSQVAQHFQYGTYRHGDDGFTMAMKKLTHVFKLEKFTDTGSAR